jgi:hypothetical protein
MMGKPILRKSMNFIGLPYRPAIPATITLAAAPTKVPFPPRQAPKARVHHNGSMGMVDMVSMVCNKGIMVATKGMLSTTEEAIADSHNTNMPVWSRFPPVSSRAFSATNSITPLTSNPPTMTNKPAKKKIVGHSTDSSVSSGSSRDISIRREAPSRAIVADSKCRA